VIRQLVAKGMVEVDVAGYGALTLTEACRPVLRGTQSVALRDGVRSNGTAASTATTRTADNADPLPDEGPKRELFEALREKRTELASEQEVPPYVIFNDKTLRAMVEHRPTTPDAFRSIHGVGDTKLERYGDTFMSVIRAFNS